MKPMRAGSGRTKETDKLLKEIDASRHVAEREPPENAGPLTCCQCGEAFVFGKGFLFENKSGTVWCLGCFKKLAEGEIAL
jgi:hypothetical protein